jgi:hypothetical protein
MLIVMSRFRRIFGLLLGTFLALGMNLSVVQTEVMSASVAMASGLGMPGHCDKCADNGGAAKAMGNCSMSCAAPVVGVIPQTPPTRVVHLPALAPLQDSLLVGQASSPDPGPPRVRNSA